MTTGWARGTRSLPPSAAGGDLDHAVPEEVAGLRDQAPAGRVAVRAARKDEQDRLLVDELEELAQGLDRGRVGPVDVLADEDRRMVAGERCEEAPEALEVGGLEGMRLQLIGAIVDVNPSWMPMR